MRFHALCATIFVEGRIDAFVYDMFHGVASRGGRPSPWFDFYSFRGGSDHRVVIYTCRRTSGGVGPVEVPWTADQTLVPLDIERNGWRVPDIACPSFQLVVSDRVMQALQKLPGIAFLRVRFAKIVHYEYRLEPYQHHGDPRFRDEDGELLEDVFDGLPAVLDYHRTIGPHHEVLMRFPREMEALHPEAEYRCVIGEPHSKQVHGLVSPRMLEEHAIIDAGSGYFMGDRTFAILEPFLDWDFFIHKEAMI